MTTGTNNVLGMLMSNSSNASFPELKQVTEPQGLGSFSNVLGNNLDRNVQLQTKMNESQIENNSQPASELKVDNKPRFSEKASEKEEMSSSELEEIADKVDAIGKEVKEVIADELDVSVEDIEKAMELLGLTAVDLIDPKNIAELVSNLEGVQDSISLVLSQEMNSILEQVGEIYNQLTNEIDISIDELKEVLAQMENVGIDEELQVMNSTEEVETEVIIPSEMNEVKYDISSDVKPLVETNANIETITDDNVDKTVEINDKVTPIITESKEQDVETENIQTTTEATTQENKKSMTQNSSGKSDEEMSDKQESSFKPESGKMEIKGRFDNEITPVSNQEFKVVYQPQTDTVELPTGESVRVQELIDQVVEQTKFMSSTERTTIEMSLNPEGLGKIYIQVSQQGDEVTAKLFAQSEAVKQALEGQMANLKMDMVNAGTKVTSIEVAVGTHEFERNLDEGQENRESNSQNEQNTNHNRRTRIDLNNLDELSGLMTEEERLVAQIMKDNGTTLNYQI